MAPNSNLMAGILRQRSRSEGTEERINTSPAKWPGMFTFLTLSFKNFIACAYTSTLNFIYDIDLFTNGSVTIT